eukprot:gene17666-biopygen14422
MVSCFPNTLYFGGCKNNKTNGILVHNRPHAYILVFVAHDALGSQDTDAGMARAWRGRGADYRHHVLLFGLGGAGVPRAWRGRGAGLSCDPCPHPQHPHTHTLASATGQQEKWCVEDSTARQPPDVLIEFMWHRTTRWSCVALVGRSYPGELAV